MNFEELDSITRAHMLDEFRSEEASGNAYRGRNLSGAGCATFPSLMEAAINHGDEQSLAMALATAAYWEPSETAVSKNGKPFDRRINLIQASERLALTEFNTWYVRGFALRLMKEGVPQCQAYRAAEPKWEPAECSRHEGQIFDVIVIYQGHRVRYHPEPGNTRAFSIPFAPNCHHTIRRV